MSMRVNVSKKFLNKLIETKEQNILLDNIYNDFFENYSRSFKTTDYLRFNKNYYEMFLDALEIDPTDRDFYLLSKRYKLNSFVLLHKDKYLSNPYYQRIKLNKEIKESNLILTKSTLLPFQAFLYKDIEVDSNDYYKEINNLGYFKESFSYIDLIDKDVTWMSITPHEIETMADSLKEVNGNVLVLGLGLGYYPFMASLKKEVKHIDVIEIDKNIIDIFNKIIFPQFEEQDKVNVIKEDALKYLANNNLNKYDYVFVDLWHTPFDAIALYIKINILLSKYTNIKASYWIENSIIALIRRAIITIFEENMLGYGDSNYQKAETEFDKLVNFIYFKLNNKNFSSEGEILDLLSNEKIKELILD